jgi:hypothetical protein
MFTHQAVRQGVGHRIGRSRQTIDLPAVRGTFANGINLRIRRPQTIIDTHCTMRRARQTGVYCQFPSRCDASGHHHEIDSDGGVFAKAQSQTQIAFLDTVGLAPQQDIHAGPAHLGQE